MKYLEKINKKCSEYNLYESIELDLNVFNDIYLDTLLDFYKSKAYEFHNNEKIVSSKIKFDYNNYPYLEFRTDYDNFVTVLADGKYYQGVDHSFIVFESGLFAKCFNSFLNVKEKEFRERITTSNSARYEFKSEMGCSLDRIISYIDNYYNDDRFDVISFYSTADENCDCGNTNNLNSGGLKRKNKLMDFNIRCEVLEDSKYTYKIEAFDRNKNVVENDYVVYCYNLPDKKVRLIAEPISGCKYTKVAYLKKDDMSLEDAKDVSKQLLEYSQSDITNIDNITRHQHSDIEKYKKLIKYILGEDDELGLGIKRSIDNASSYEERFFVRKR